MIPRQSGKTTLVRRLLAEKPCVSLETPAQREFACSQPAEFLHQFHWRSGDWRAPSSI